MRFGSVNSERIRLDEACECCLGAIEFSLSQLRPSDCIERVLDAIRRWIPLDHILHRLHGRRQYARRVERFAEPEGRFGSQCSCRLGIEQSIELRNSVGWMTSMDH